MAKTITLRLNDEFYKEIAERAKSENRPISNFIEVATRHYIINEEFTDDLEMAEILSNKKLLGKLKRGARQVTERKGKFVKGV